MKFENHSISTQSEILNRILGGELLEPITITDAKLESEGVVKAGSPIAADGTIANSASAVGVLLNDVYAENPNGSLVKGFAEINKANAEKNAGITFADACISALGNLVFA